MFRSAVAEAAKFTYPIVMSRKLFHGGCTAGNGAFVVVNDEGWIVTAAHIMRQVKQLVSDEAAARAHEKRAADIRADTSLDHKARSRELSRLGRLANDSTDRAAVWWGGLGTGVTNVAEAPGFSEKPNQAGMDLAIGRLIDFDKTKVAGYPKFKIPSAGYAAGAALCKLGFPFFEVTPTFDQAASAFLYPQGALPPQMFPIEGILTRIQTVQVVDKAGNILQSQFPLTNIETSSPGLRGQSGGPMFDVDGAVWALQCFTSHTPLGFSPTVKIAGKDHVEHQFINLGVGPASTTIADLLTTVGVRFEQTP